MHVGVLVIAAVGVGGGIVLVAADLADGTDEWHGFLAFIGAMIGAASAVVAGLAGLLLAMTVRGRRRADSGDVALLRGSAMVSSVLSGVVLLGVVLLVVQALAAVGSMSTSVGLVALAPAVMTLAAGVGTLRSLRA